MKADPKPCRLCRGRGPRAVLAGRLLEELELVLSLEGWVELDLRKACTGEEHV